MFNTLGNHYCISKLIINTVMLAHEYSYFKIEDVVL